MPDVRMPDGTIIRNVPANASRDQIMAAHERAKAAGQVPDSRPKSFWRGFGDSLHTASGNLEKINPMAMLSEAIAPVRDQYETKYMNSRARGKYQGSTAGKVVGGIAASLPTLALPGGAIVQGGASGALLSNARDFAGLAGDVATGMIGGKVGDVVGKRVIAPAAGAIGRAIPPSVKNKAGKYVSTLLTAPRVSKGEKAILQTAAPRTFRESVLDAPSAAMAEVRKNLADAARLKLPYALADASPKLGSLAGSASRKSTDAYALAKNTFGPRAEDQGVRAIRAINENFTPPADPVAVKQGITAAGRAKAGPLYDEAFNGPAVWSPRIQQFLDDPITAPALKRGIELQRIDALAKGEPFDPTRLSVTSFNEAGEPVLAKVPNMETLDLVKRGFDDLVREETDLAGKMTGKGMAVNNLRKAFVSELDNINPQYGKARGAAQDYIRTANALDTGMKAPAPKVMARDVERQLAQMTPKEAAQYRSGYATTLRDQVANTSDNTNPYNKIYGGTERRDKIGAVFPEGAEDFNRIYRLEQDMGRTAYDTIGGSPTASRLASDQQFDTNIGNAMDMGINAMTGNPMGMLRSGARWVGDTAKVGVGKARADEMAPTLFNTDPKAAIALLEEILKKEAEKQAQRRAWGGLLGAG
ncbi:MAG: hypothetical protein RIS17_1533, partial [Pseudomonadota bacterium]